MACHQRCYINHCTYISLHSFIFSFTFIDSYTVSGKMNRKGRGLFTLIIIKWISVDWWIIDWWIDCMLACFSLVGCSSRLLLFASFVNVYSAARTFLEMSPQSGVSTFDFPPTNAWLRRRASCARKTNVRLRYFDLRCSSLLFLSANYLKVIRLQWNVMSFGFVGTFPVNLGIFLCIFR